MSRPTLAWIASYPKSGNTWMRLFLANYLVGGEAPLPINQLHRFVMFDAAASNYVSAGLPAFDPIRQPLAGRSGRSRMLEWVAGRADLTFVKTHMPRQPVDGQMLIPESLTRAAVYIVRDPRDVAVSYARHFVTTPQDAAAIIGKPETIIRPNPKTIAQPIGSWSDHVAGWTDAEARRPAHAVRYEDMLTDPERTFTSTIENLGLPVEADRLQHAIAASSFQELRRQEALDGFHEHPKLRQAFFHTGEVGQWASLLPAEAVRRIEIEHAEQMARFGYLSGTG